MMQTQASPQNANAASVTVGGPERLERTADTLGTAFNDDRTIRVMTRKLPEPERILRLPTYLHILAKGGALNDGIFFEAGDYGAVGILMKPKRDPANTFTMVQAGGLKIIKIFGWSSVYRALTDFGPATEKIQKQAFGKSKDYYYLWLLATRPERQGQGLASAMLRQIQAKAQAEGRPIYLETANPRAKAVYERCGFQVASEFMLGRGNSDKDGYARKGGSGVTNWGMVWRPTIQ